MNIAICEDEPIHAAGMRDAIEVWARSRGDAGTQILLYASAEDLWEDWERGSVFDALFLDIEFRDMSGFELAQRIRSADPNIPIIFYDGFTITRKGLTLRLPYRDVLYIMSGVHSVYIHTRQGQTHHVPLRGTFGHYASTFPQAYFLRCHRGYIVNVMHACQYTQKFIRLGTGDEIPIGRNFMEETLARLQEYFYKEAHV